MRRRLLSRLLAATAGLIVLPAASLAAPGQAIDAPAFARAEASIREALVAAGAPGAAVAVVSGDRVIWAQGLGVANTETGAPVTADTLFQIGSATKMFTAAAVLSAASSGAIALDRPVGGYVSGLARCLAAPTLAQLLSHTGGVIDEPDEYGPQGEEALAAYARTWPSEYCLLPPGRAFSYSNSGFALAGLALQEADKKPFADIMRARVLAPLGMPRTTFRPTDAMTWPLAVGHRKDKAGNVTVVRPLANDARLWPAGTLYSSANEMARFAMALLNDGVVDGKPALPPGVVARMRAAAAAIPTTGQRYGQGLFLTGDPAYGHGGTMTGYVASVTILPEAKLGIVVLTNGDNADPAAIENAVRVAAGQRPPATDASPPTASSPSPAGDAYLGTFRNPRRFTVEVVRQGEGLVLKRFGRDFPMRFAAPGRFLVDLPRGGTETIVFGLGPDGHADYLQMNVWALARVTP
jgi:CubicO group peptidase (beta-lactamase class C family)